MSEDKEHVLGVLPVNINKDRTKVKFTALSTHTGHKLTMKQALFIEEYINSGGKLVPSMRYAGYKIPERGASRAAAGILNTPYIREEIEYQLSELKKHNIADREEILEYFTAVMRGEVKDQFGLDAPLGERTDAAKELAKRIIDAPDKLQGKQETQVTITLDWTRDPNNEDNILTIPVSD